MKIIQQSVTQQNPLITPFEDAVMLGKPCSAVKESIKESIQKPSQDKSDLSNSIVDILV